MPCIKNLQARGNFPQEGLGSQVGHHPCMSEVPTDISVPIYAEADFTTIQGHCSGTFFDRHIHGLMMVMGVQYLHAIQIRNCLLGRGLYLVMKDTHPLLLALSNMHVINGRRLLDAAAPGVILNAGCCMQLGHHLLGQLIAVSCWDAWVALTDFPKHIASRQGHEQTQRARVVLPQCFC